MWQLTLFGGFGLDGARALTGRAAQRKRQALLALLGGGAHPQISRDKAVALLWPELDDERARQNLASAIYDLRQVMGDDVILAAGEDLRLNPERVRSDVREFDAAIDRQDFAAATSLRTGPFLDGFHVTGAPEFERWVDGERDRLDQRLAYAIEQLAEQCSAAGDHSEAARHLQKLAAQQPYNSRVALLYMQALDRSGDTAGAIRHARTHELLTQQEFGVAADEQIAAFVAELRGRAGAQERVSVGAQERGSGDRQERVTAGAQETAAALPDAPSQLRERRSHVFRVAAVYAAGAFVLLQAADLLSTGLGLPAWVFKSITIATVVGFPLTLILAWLYHVRRQRPTDNMAVASPASRPRTLRWALGAGVTAVIVMALFAIRTSARERDPSIAVLPFKSLGGGEENAYFAEGIHEDLLTQLAKFHDMKVISRTSVMQYRDAQVNIREIGRALDVAVVLEGSVRRVGNQVRVVAQLIDAHTDKHLWAETYDRELTNVFSIQTEIAQNIARVLHADLGANQKASDVAAPTTVSEAYDIHLQARNIIYSTPVLQIDYPKAESLLLRAIKLDPNFALAYADLARLYAGLIWTGRDPSSARVAAATKALEQAARLRPNAAETHLAAGYYWYWARRDFPRALQELEQARAQLPGSAEVLHLIGVIQRRTGDLHYAIENFSNAAQRDPARSLSFTYLGETLFALGRFEEANRAYQNALMRAPTDPYTLRSYGDMYVAWRGSTDTLRAAGARIMPTGSLGALQATRFRVAMLERDCAAAEAAMADAPELIGGLSWPRPRALFQALAAECGGHHARAKGFYRDAERLARKAIAQEGAHAALHMVIGQAMVGQGKIDEGLAAARRALEDPSYQNDGIHMTIQYVHLAALYARAEKFEQALTLLEKYCGQPWGIWPNELRMEPRWDVLRAQPRFQALLRSSCRSK